ncbi:GNAT family N-acetyltransferase [Streptomyces griseoluteus]|uniref:GNAT family N-acetyltransferase n=1 Tax=Streptomyces griseoluteus TaxID=29306 RepID=UPI003700B89C
MAERTAVVRPLGRPGDLGWVVMAHGEFYDREFGWDTDFETLVCRIAADYADGKEPGPQAAWIAEVDGRRAGCVFCVRADARTARLRLLLVDPAARGLGVGARLIEECLTFAREAGYEAITLWTNDVLGSARRLYERHGFRLIAEDRHHSFGHDLVGQTWRRSLRPSITAGAVPPR